MITLNGVQYEIVVDEKDAVQEEEINERYSDILKKYDYIVGDWGYGQLRLKGFYDAKHPKVSFDSNINMLDDYLYEYCNFGCAYFVIKKIYND